MEVWKDVVGYEGKYQVSNSGRVASVRKEIILKPLINKGYEYLQLGRGVNKAVHRLVMESFVGASDLSVDHIDCQKRNNNLSNLQYVTISENTKLSFKRGTAAVGSKKNQSKIKESDVLEIRRMLENGSSLKQISEKYSISLSTISFIKNRKTWNHV